MNALQQRMRAIAQQLLDHTSYAETPNLYIEKDLGYKLIEGPNDKQRVKVKRVSDTAGVSWLMFDKSFKIS